MGDVIRSSAATEEIIKDVRATMTNAVARGGKIKQRAEQGLGPVLQMIGAVETDLKEAQTVLAPLRAELLAENDRADASLMRVYDDVWNDAGRPASDRHLNLLFPGGAAYYTEGDLPGQPLRMELLARLFDRKLHPLLTPEQHASYAERVRDAATALKADLEAIAEPQASLTLLERVLTALGRNAHFELGNLKRAYKSDGMTEAAIHEIIPDRPVSKKPTKKAAQPPADAEPATPPAPPNDATLPA